jgi:hypothetical protein
MSITRNNVFAIHPGDGLFCWVFNLLKPFPLGDHLIES